MNTCFLFWLKVAILADQKSLYKKKPYPTKSGTVQTSRSNMRRLILFILVNGLLGAVPSLAASHGVILQYHHVADNTPPSTSVSPTLFLKHLQFLKDHGFTVWPLSKLVGQLQAGKPVPDGVVVITFDDAYEDIATNAAPVLKRFGYPFTVFVATLFVHNRQHGYMTWEQIRALQKQGAEIANHTHSHPHLLRLNPGETEIQWQARVKNEIETAEAQIKQNTRDDFRYLAWPYGETDARLIALVKSWGYIGFGQESGAVNKAELDSGSAPRYPFNTTYHDMTDFQYKASSLPLPVEGIKAAPTVAKVGDKPVLELRLPSAFKTLHCYASGQGRIEAEVEKDGWFKVLAPKAMPVGRSRYNCTEPVGKTELKNLTLKLAPRFYWYSHMWIRKQADDSWYPEP